MTQVMKQLMAQVIEQLRIVASHKQRECHMGQGIKQALRQVMMQVMKRVVTRVRCEGDAMAMDNGRPMIQLVTQTMARGMTRVITQVMTQVMTQGMTRLVAQ